MTTTISQIEESNKIGLASDEDTELNFYRNETDVAENEHQNIVVKDDPAAAKFDKALKASIKCIVDITIQTSAQFQKLQNMKDDHEITSEIQKLATEEDFLSSSDFLKHYNKVCKFEKQKEINSGK